MLSSQHELTSLRNVCSTLSNLVSEDKTGLITTITDKVATDLP